LRDPDAAFADFMNATGRAEDQLVDPLVLAGPRVRPVVLTALQNPEFRLRRYAIEYLGCARYEPATSTLQGLLSDELQQDYLRADALTALWLMDAINRMHLARQYASRQDSLGSTARGLIDASTQPSCRSWIAAFLHRHN
jgi:HEAT repeat protein